MTEKRHQCASNLGFILAAAGSAVGLGIAFWRKLSVKTGN